MILLLFSRLRLSFERLLGLFVMMPWELSVDCDLFSSNFWMNSSVIWGQLNKLSIPSVFKLHSGSTSESWTPKQDFKLSLYKLECFAKTTTCSFLTFKSNSILSHLSLALYLILVKDVKFMPVHPEISRHSNAGKLQKISDKALSVSDVQRRSENFFKVLS